MPRADTGRNLAIYEARERGEPLAAIGRTHGISRVRARQIWEKEYLRRKYMAENPESFRAMGLSTRAENSLRCVGLKTPSDVREWIAKGGNEETLMTQLKKIGNVGNKTAIEIAEMFCSS